MEEYQPEKDKQAVATHSVDEWQNKLVVWTVLMPTLLILVFVVLATMQLNRFNDEISQYQEPQAAYQDPMYGLPTTAGAEYAKLYTLAKMEDLAMRKRYSQGGVLLMSRIFTKYLGFFTGMVMAIVGAVFIISKIREESTNLTGSVSQQANLTLVSSSPGIIFGVLGTVLMLATILQHTEINIKDMPLYLNHYNLTSPNGQPLNPGLGPDFEKHVQNMPEIVADTVTSSMKTARPDQ